jgi:flagellar protein FliS
MARRDLVTKRAAMSRAMAIVGHLQGTLNMEEGQDVAQRLDALYLFVMDKIVEANLKQRPSALDEAAKVLSTLRDAWSEIATSAPSAQP